MKNSTTTFFKLAITYLSFIFLAILFTSCSKEDDLIILEEPTPQLCVKRTVDYSSEWSINTNIYSYNYDGSKLLDWTETRIDDNSTTTTTYSNVYIDGNITSIIVSGSNGTTVYDFEYDNLGRVTKQFKNLSLEFRYSYIGDSVKKYNDLFVLIGEQVYDQNNNLVLNKTKQATDSTWTQVLNYENDNMNMPFKNVESWYPLSPFRYVGHNNITKVETNTTTINMNISYDFNDFPEYIETIYSDGRSKSETLEYNN